MCSVKELLWELAVMNFCYELLGLDVHAFGLDRPDECHKCFAGNGLIGLDFHESQRGLAARLSCASEWFLANDPRRSIPRKSVRAGAPQVSVSLSEKLPPSIHKAFEVFGRASVILMRLKQEIPYHLHRSIEPIILVPGSHISVSLALTLQTFLSNSPFDFLSKSQPQRLAMNKISTIQPDPSPSSSGLTTATLRLVRVYQGLTALTDAVSASVELRNELRDPSVLDGLSSAGGLWTFANGAFVFLFGADLLYLLGRFVELHNIVIGLIVLSAASGGAFFKTLLGSLKLLNLGYTKKFSYGTKTARQTKSWNRTKRLWGLGPLHLPAMNARGKTDLKRKRNSLDPTPQFTPTPKFTRRTSPCSPYTDDDSVRKGRGATAQEETLIRPSIHTLARPMTPPSPPDDPLLLVFPSPTKRKAHVDYQLSDGSASSVYNSHSPVKISVLVPVRTTLIARANPPLHQTPPQPASDLHTFAKLDELDSATTLVRTKSDPGSPPSEARAAAWGVWGSPWPGRGPNGIDSIFRMDGRRLFVDIPEAAGRGNLRGSKGPFDFDSDSGEAPPLIADTDAGVPPAVQEAVGRGGLCRSKGPFDFDFGLVKAPPLIVDTDVVVPRAVEEAVGELRRSKGPFDFDFDEPA
ncbi:hypothetical protein B0H14DRAFT_3769123 [Mycena olivaceomarginata]|nr:hypothetical protein B0H14DRAFT_3769123 [Mycena olivaceomarginata]